jgi:hypothetical protein
MSATVKKPEQAMDKTWRQRCCPCSWAAYIKGSVYAIRDLPELFVAAGFSIWNMATG